MDGPIGAHCSLSSCNINDFLPIKCKCDHLFCKDHIFPDAHSCPVASAGPSETNTPAEKLQRCAVDGCRKPSLEAFVSTSTRADSEGRSAALCSGCNKAFCAEHREPKFHSCVPLKAENGAEDASKNAKARALLNKHFPSSQPSSSSLSEPKTSSDKVVNPKKLAQIKQVQLMKMRHKAKPADPRDKPTSVSLEQRLYVQVSTETDTTPVPYWFRKTTVAGKAIDLLANHFKMSSSTAPLYLLNATEDGSTLLNNSTPLPDQLDDGSSVVLSRHKPPE
ncbi:hypothetical protein EIP91_006626 [Steccherinum ochraceum]|uniref:AN1-type domain-containing protein n=1 Tax=Steccherinum ochraceum TaxID=92696 RepID=A0A4R0R5K1_9APHY|nr:hypothetical protein EIP91_006626 [Steccherinum ochraceum]